MTDVVFQDRVFTKFVERRWLEDTLNGRIKFGSLASYRVCESGSEDRLTDNGEGCWTRSTYDSIGATITDANGNSFTNIRNLGGGRTISRRSRFNAYIFCATLGSYNARTHTEIHARNPTLAHYVCFDGPAFVLACIELQRALYPDAPLRVGHAPVRYCDARESILSARELIQGVEPNNFADAVLTKPLRFKHEQEIRFVLGPAIGEEQSSVFTSSYPGDLQARFRMAVVSSGELQQAA